MSRSVWAAAGASALALVLTPGVAMAAVGGRSAARPAGVHAKRDEHPRRRASTRLGQAAARASARRQVRLLLVPGNGYDQQQGGNTRERKGIKHLDAVQDRTQHAEKQQR